MPAVSTTSVNDGAKSKAAGIFASRAAKLNVVLLFLLFPIWAVFVELLWQRIRPPSPPVVLNLAAWNGPMTIERLLADGSRKPFGAGQQFTPKMLECIQSLTRELTICDLNNSLNGTTAVPLPIGWTKVAEATGDKSGRKISLYQTPDGKLAFEAAGRCAVSSRAIDDPVVHFVMTGEVR